MITFGGIEPEFSGYKDAKILLQSIPYDGTSTWGKGADKGFNIFLEATENMELYDIETDSEVYRKGIHITPQILEDRSPEHMFKSVYQHTKDLLKSDKFLTFYGGEHSISIGIIKAFYEKYPDITVLQLDAHADLRPTYLGSKYNHACALFDASQNTNLIPVGIRSMDVSEKEFINYDKCFFAQELASNSDWMNQAIDMMTDKVYITLDLDVFDPAIMPSTGTPEPGGMQWETVIGFLRKIFKAKNVLGFDLVEHAPIKGFKAPDFMVAKLYYKMLSYKFENHEK